MSQADTDLRTAEIQYEDALVALKQATDSRGLKIMLGPPSRSHDSSNPLRFSMPAARDYGVYLKDFLRHIGQESVFLDNEANYARNCKLLAAAWEAAARYEELKKRYEEQQHHV